MTATVATNQHVAFFSVVNLGTSPIRGATFDLTVSKGNSNKQTSLTISACTGTWDETAVTCSGTIVPLFTVTSPGGQASTATVPITPGTSMRLLAQASQPGWTLTVSVSVAAPAQTRSPSVMAS